MVFIYLNDEIDKYNNKFFICVVVEVLNKLHFPEVKVISY